MFPHAYGAADDKYFTTKLTLSPAGDELTLDFAKTLLDKERLGEDDVPDYLAISFSSTDYVGHLFGASSLETEDNLARLDRTLADLFAYVDEKIGLANTLIVLSADHGQPEVPGYLHQLGIAKAHYFDTKALDKTPAITALKQQFGIGEELIEAYFHPYIYLNRDLIEDKGLDQAAVEQAVAEQLKQFKGVADAVSSSALRAARLPDTLLMRTILRNFHPKRSGDIYLIFEPDVFINDFDGLIVAATHGSPWRYDTIRAGDLRGRRLAGDEGEPCGHALRYRADLGDLPQCETAVRCYWYATCGSVVKVRLSSTWEPLIKWLRMTRFSN